MPVVTAAILPHGGGLIEGFEEDWGDYASIRRSVVDCANRIMVNSPDTVVIVSPHNLRIKEYMAVINAEYLAGTLRNGRRKVEASLATDRKLAAKIYSLALKRKLPVVLVNYGTDRGANSKMPLDWGSIVPLHFMRSIRRGVLLTPSREVPLSQLVEMGVCVHEAASESKAKVVFVASADQAHAHSKKGPYGYDKAAAKFDRLIMQTLKHARLEDLVHIDGRLVERAKPDSLWQMLMLAGVIKSHPMKLRYLRYDCPGYYGMLTAAFY